MTPTLTSAGRYWAGLSGLTSWEDLAGVVVTALTSSTFYTTPRG